MVNVYTLAPYASSSYTSSYVVILNDEICVVPLFYICIQLYVHLNVVSSVVWKLLIRNQICPGPQYFSEVLAEIGLDTTAPRVKSK